MKFIFHGGAREVGKSCIELQTNGQRYLMDAGVKFVQGGIEYPKFLDNIYDIDGIFLSHAHLDHSGALPMLENKKLNCPIYCTPMTWKITNLLLQDSYHLEKLKHVHPAYVERDIKAVQNDLRLVHYNTEYDTKDKKSKFQLLNAGHIPGSSCILFQTENKKILYTGDVNTEETLLMMPSMVDQLQDIDILICENTYGERMHPDRKESNSSLLKAVIEGLNGGGSVLLPVFSVGRAQEVLIILSKLGIDVPIYLDGMAREVSRLTAESNDPYIANKDILEKMVKQCIFVEHGREREKIAKKKGIVIVTSSGMMQGGPSVAYAEHFIHNPNNYIVLTGYQANGTRGRSLFEDRLFYNKGQRYPVKCHVRKYDFSAHYGQDSIRNLIKRINPKHLILVHGDLEAVNASKRWAESMIDGQVHMPYIGEEITIDGNRVEEKMIPAAKAAQAQQQKEMISKSK